MNVTDEIKDEILENGFETDAARKAFLSAVIRFCGSIHIDARGAGLSIDTDSPQAARAAAGILSALYGIDAEIACNKPNTVLKKRSFSLEILPKNAKTALVDCGIMSFEDCARRLDEVRFEGECVRAFIAGAFVCAGGLSLPAGADDASGYYLELDAESETLADELFRLLSDAGIAMKRAVHGESFSLYIKTGETVSDFLAACGASRGVLKLNCIMADKTVRNAANRATNCNIANLNKAVDAGAKQCADIAFIDKKIGISSLSDKLQQAARARLENPDMTYEELAEAIGGDIGKSGVHHRFRKIEEIAAKLSDTGEK